MKKGRNKMATKLKILIEEEGYESIDEAIREVGNDSVVPGICMRHDCDCTSNVEPDQDAGFCPACQNNSVKSLFILLGVI